MSADLKSGASATSQESDDGLSDGAKWALISCGSILGAIFLLILARLIVLGPYYRKKNRIDGKVVVITGCNTGIGKETALELAKRGGKIYMACRNSAKCEEARLEIIGKSKNQNVFNRTLDLASLESIRKFVERFLEEESRLDILINNAGILATPKGYTKDGFEQQFGVNHLGHFYLTNLLLGTLKASGPSRIIVLSSLLYLFGKIKKDDINSEKSYAPVGAYCQSKLANVLFTVHLSKLLTDTTVTVNCLHPGVVKTDIFQNVFKKKLKIILTPIRTFFFKTRKAGAQTSIRLAIDPSIEDVSGKYYLDCYFRVPIIPKGKDSQMAQWLWEISEEMTGLNKSKVNAEV